MTVVVWRIATETPAYKADDISGKGAALSGGRWNAVGTPMLYCASNISLAALETLSHLRGGSLPLNRFLIHVSIPDEVWETREEPKRLPGGWNAIPAGLTSESFGERWVREKRSALLLVPSVIVPEEKNILINPSHPDAVRIKAKTGRRWDYDPRFF